jgi:hypothetical protein
LKTLSVENSHHKWTFASRFRRQAFGWRSALPIQRLKEAVTEIKLAARTDPVLAANGAILLLEKLSPALEQVDSSSGALGSAVTRAIDLLVPIIAAPDVAESVREMWLERLFDALQEDRIPYIEQLGEFWGQLCVTPAIASAWADRLLGITTRVLGPDGHGEFFTGTTGCLSAIYGAQRYDELIRLVDSARLNWWHYRRWGVDALVALGRPAEALRYAQASQETNAPAGAVAKACDAILLASGMVDEAYTRYAIEANEGATYLATFRAIVRKYPHKLPGDILHDLVVSAPGSEGKWFAAAKDAGLYDLAVSLAKQGPTDPRTLTRAAKDFGVSEPEFAMSCGLSSLHWMSAGYGYDIARADVLAAYAAVVRAGETLGIATTEINTRIRAQLGNHGADRSVVAEVLSHQLR